MWSLKSLRRATLRAESFFVDILKDRTCLVRIHHYFGMGVDSLKTDELRIIMRQNGFNVKVLAISAGLHVRTLERRFSQQLRTTPKAWLMRERMSLALPLLVNGSTNKEVAHFLCYSCESNFCRDFKRWYGCTPQEFGRSKRAIQALPHSDKELSRFDKGGGLPSAFASLKNRTHNLARQSKASNIKFL